MRELRLGDSNDDVKVLQRSLATMPFWSSLVVDGDFGPKTDAAVRAFQNSCGMQPDGIVGPRTWAALLPVMAPPSPIPSANHPLVDRRAFASSVHVYGERAWSDVTGITLHQTACVLGERPGRWDAIGCHVGITRGGQEIWLHDWNKLVVHGNGWNTRCVGIEMDGLYAGLAGDVRTVWDDPTTPTRERGLTPTLELVLAASACVRRICAEVASHGGRVRFLVAHRQSSMDRRNDPGEELWKAVALPLMDELGLVHGDTSDFKVGGYAIPESWDPRCKGVPY